MVLAVVLFLVPAGKRVIKGEPLDGLAVTFLCLAIVYLIWILAIVVGRKSDGRSRPPSA
jgi:hypothetical protein